MTEEPGADEALLERMRADWNARAREDAYYYVAFARPGQTAEEFQSTADAVIPHLEAELVRLPRASERRALEIGCGPGRLMIPMSRHFAEIYGVDVSDEMIKLAKEFLRDTPNAQAHTNNGKDLSLFQADFFDYVYSFIVFQHIPSKSIVLNYLREVLRVLKPGGIFLGHFRGAEGNQTPDTWSGCSFTRDEIVEFAGANGFQVFAISGEGTQYMLVTLGKPEESSPVDLSAISILMATAADGQASIPARGAGACVSLCIGGAPADGDLATLLVTFNGIPAAGCYLSPAGDNGRRQLNIRLPKGVAIGENRITLTYGGQRVAESRIEITPPPRRDPRLIRLTDGVNLLAAMRIENRCVQATMEDIARPGQVELHIAGQRLDDLRFRCVDRILDRYDYVAALPDQIPAGFHRLTIRVDGCALPTDLEVEVV